jgi:hypothetical protein
LAVAKNWKFEDLSAPLRNYQLKENPGLFISSEQKKICCGLEAITTALN